MEYRSLGRTDALGNGGSLIGPSPEASGLTGCGTESRRSWRGIPAASRVAAQIRIAWQQRWTAWGRFAAFVQGMCEEQAAAPVFNDVFSRRYPDAPDLRAVCDQSLAFGAELIRDAQSCGTLRPGFSAGDLTRIFSVNAYLVRDRPAGDDGWRRTLHFTLDGLRAQPDSTSG
jgi:transcriptional regulator SbtR-like protein